MYGDIAFTFFTHDLDMRRANKLANIYAILSRGTFHAFHSFPVCEAAHTHTQLHREWLCFSAFAEWRLLEWRGIFAQGAEIADGEGKKARVRAE